jgi:hypothetical protein
MSQLQLFKYFSNIDDPRQQGKVVHKLFDILFLTISAVIAGCQGWEEIEDFGHDRLDWLRKFVSFENGIPKHDTIARAGQDRERFLNEIRSFNELPQFVKSS